MTDDSLVRITNLLQVKPPIAIQLGWGDNALTTFTRNYKGNIEVSITQGSKVLELFTLSLEDEAKFRRGMELL